MNFNFQQWIMTNFLSLIITAVVIFIAWLSRKMVLRYLSKKIDDIEAYIKWRRISNISIYLIISLAILTIWYRQLSFLIIFTLIVILGLVISLKEPILNLAGWIYILLAKPFKIGDRIQVKEYRGYRGDVLEIHPFSFKVIEIGSNPGNWVDGDVATGRVVDIPNGWVFIHPLANYNRMIDHIWNELQVKISFDSNWKKAKKILLEKITDIEDIRLSSSKKKSILKDYRVLTQKYPELQPIVYARPVDGGIQLILRYLCDTRKRSITSVEIWETMLQEFSKHKDIELV